MPLNRYVVRVDPQGQTVVVDILDTSGVSVVAYESSQFGAATLTLPLTITAPTDFWLHDPGPYDVSCKVGGAEVADAGAPQRVEVSDVPVLVVPDWERQRAASPGGSSSVEYYAVEASPGTVVADNASATVTGWSVDASGGSSVALDVDGQTFHVAPGVYQYTIGTTIGGGTVTSAFFGLIGTIQRVLADWGPINSFNYPNTSPGSAAQQGQILVTAASTIEFTATVAGGGTLDYVGLDLIRIGDIAPANP